MTAFETFFKLHHAEKPLLIANAWDITSAKIFEQLGFEAIATSSSAIAYSFGYEDGENIPFDLLLQTVKRIIGQINVPLSVDMERGYSSNIAGIIQNIEKLHDLGAVGINIEDSIMEEKRKLRPVEDFQKILSAIKNGLGQKKINMYINARTDAFLLKASSPLEETIKRIRAYENEGATGIFVPFISDKKDIGEVVKATRLPVNVLCAKQLPSFKELEGLGVKRISMGGAIYKAMTKSIEQIVKTIREEQSFESISKVIF